MKQFEKIIESQVKIRFSDCDPFNHLNNSRYIDYMINAREDQVLAAYDFDIHRLAREKGISWVVAQNQIAYLVPASVMETVTIQTRLISCDEKNLRLEALMWNENKTILKAVLWSRLTHFDLRTKKSHFHSEELIIFFKEIEQPLEDSLTFEERVKGLKAGGMVTGDARIAAK